MEKTNKYYGIIENIVKKHSKFPGNESLLEEIIDDVYTHSEVIINSINNESVINAYLEKVVSTSMITVPKKHNIKPVRKTQDINISAVRQTGYKPADMNLVDKMINSNETEVKPVEVKEVNEAENNNINLSEVSLEEFNDFSENAVDLSQNEIDENKQVFANNSTHIPDFQPENTDGLDDAPLPDITPKTDDADFILEQDSIDASDLSFKEDDFALIENEETVDKTADEGELEQQIVVSIAAENTSAEVSMSTESDVNEASESGFDIEDLSVNDDVEPVAEISNAEENEEDTKNNIDEIALDYEEISYEEPIEEPIEYQKDESSEETTENVSEIEEISLLEDDSVDNVSLEEQSSVNIENNQTDELTNDESSLDLVDAAVELENTDEEDETLQEVQPIEEELTAENTGELEFDDGLDLSDSLEEYSDNNELDVYEEPVELESSSEDFSLDETDSIQDSLIESIDEENIVDLADSAAEQGESNNSNNDFIDYSMFHYTPKNKDDDIDENEVVKEILDLSKKRPELNIIKVYNLKYKDKLPVSDIAEQLEMSNNNVIEALNEIISIV